ncbi:MAG: shikimate dehydrogenase [Acetobacteraceae bacterium]|nr:shikimate dehydrogenase [Acetobacteraceae bacterium]
MLPRIVDGASLLFGIVGDPVAQVRSPPLWSALFRRNGINAVCVPFHVHPPAFAGFISGLRAAENVLGLFVTIPHKIAAAKYAGALTERARKVGTANILRPLPDGRWEGDIADGVGFVLALRASGQRIEGRRAIVVGAGGVGSAIAFALAEAGVASVALSDVDQNRAKALAQRIAVMTGVPSTVVPARAEGFDLIVNASPLGMRAGDAMPLDLAGLTAEAIVGDVVISATLTPVLEAARARGCHVQPGSAMTDHQVAPVAAFLGLETGDWGPAAVREALGE